MWFTLEAFNYDSLSYNDVNRVKMSNTFHGI